MVSTNAQIKNTWILKIIYSKNTTLNLIISSMFKDNIYVLKWLNSYKSKFLRHTRGHVTSMKRNYSYHFFLIIILPMGFGTAITLQQSNGKLFIDQITGWTRSWIFNDMAAIQHVSALTAVRLKNNCIQSSKIYLSRKIYIAAWLTSDFCCIWYLFFAKLNKQ